MTTIRATSGVPADNPDVVRWWRAANQGFHGERLSDDQLNRLVENAYADQFVLREVRDRDLPAPGDPERPVATFASVDGTINVGAGNLLPARLITDVTVRPTHRRRGLLRTMMTADLDSAVEAGLPCAALTVTEGSIYRRFGFGPATFEARVTVDTGARFSMLTPPPGGPVVMVDAARVDEIAAEVFDSFHHRVIGSVSRFSHVPMIVSGLWDGQKGRENRMTRGAVHLSADGRPDGYVTWVADRAADFYGKITIVDLVATTDASYLDLWDFLGHIDLINEVQWRQAPVEDPLRFALSDPNLYRVNALRPNVWLRVLDVAKTLQARPWSGAGAVVIEVSDPLGHAEGRYRVEVADGHALVNRTQEPAELTMDVATLGSIALGGARPSVLAAAGLITAAGDNSTAHVDQLFASTTPVWGITHF